MPNLVKLKIESFSKPDCDAGSRLNYILAVVNPDSYSRDFKIDYDNPEIIGDAGNTSFFAGMGTSTFSLKRLVVDGTGVIPIPGANDVDDYIEKFSNVVYSYQGALHRPPYLKISWGNLMVIGVCTSMKVDYKLFKPDGTALRAFIDLTLIESTDPATLAKEAGRSSSDLTHERIVKAGDTLPLMAYEIYGDSSLYVKVAEANNMNSFMDIKPGDKIFFPPFKN
jgi:hypothetical protein